MRRLAQLALSLCLIILVSWHVPASSKSPATDWTQTVSATPEGGFAMGNPAARIKLVEFASMTCPHCATFDAEAHDRLETYIRAGTVSYEIRNMVRDPFDITAALIARCGGPRRFFKITHSMLGAQATWMGTLQALPQSQFDALQPMTPQDQHKTIAKMAGLSQYGIAEGLAASEIDACLADPAGSEKLIQMNSDAMQNHAIRSVPAFVVNGQLVEGSTWAELEPHLLPMN